MTNSSDNLESDPTSNKLTLLKITIEYCINNIDNTLYDKDNNKLKDGITLPNEICEMLLNYGVNSEDDENCKYDPEDEEYKDYTSIEDEEEEEIKDELPVSTLNSPSSPSKSKPKSESVAPSLYTRNLLYKIVNILKDTQHTRLESINIRNSSFIDDRLFYNLIRHSPILLDIHNCPKLTTTSLSLINKYCHNKLESLIIGDSGQFVIPYNSKVDFSSSSDYDDDDNEEESNILEIESNKDISDDGDSNSVSTKYNNAAKKKERAILNLSKLKKLVIWNIIIKNYNYWNKLLNQKLLSNLYYLDLNGCCDFPISLLLNCKNNLYYLSLYNVLLIRNNNNNQDNKTKSLSEDAENLNNEKNFNYLCELINLRYLDISQSSENACILREPTRILTKLVTSLKYLTSLDISGSNLAGRGICDTMNGCDIPGLDSRINRPLEYLGLYGTHHDASHRVHIPAKRISGDKDEEQILTACQVYIDRHEILEKVLNDLFHLFRGEKVNDIKRSTNLILQSMRKHINEKHIQISCSASLFYIVKSFTEGNDECSGIKKEIIRLIIKAMEKYKYDLTMIRNGCLTICHFKIPQDVIFQYEKLVKILLDILSLNNNQQQGEDFIERISIYLLNSLVCQVDGNYKLLVGKLGGINKMLDLIRERLSRNECDDVMEIAWSTMWNVTDETEYNCNIFLDAGGMNLFLNCLENFPDKSELLRNMMGLLGNVAEVPYLRKRLITKEYINVFYKLLDSTQDNIEVSYNSAGILSHILSDNDEQMISEWPLKIINPTRKQVQDNLRKNINRWDINSSRNINYRSFEPILRLLKQCIHVETVECQLWAVWALANLTKVYPQKYCPLLKLENGLVILKTLLGRSTDSDIIKYTSLIFSHCSQFENRENGEMDEFMDG